MKKIYIILLSVILIYGSSYAQNDNDEIRTIINGEMEVSGFGGPMMSFTMLGGEFAHIMGGGGGVILGRQLIMGGYGMGTTTTRTADTPGYEGKTLEIGHGGLMFGYVINPQAVIHPAITIQTGWGGVTLLDDKTYSDKDNVFVINPALEIEANFTRFFKVGIGGHYQWTSGMSKWGYSSKDFSGAGVFLSFKFGWF